MIIEGTDIQSAFNNEYGEIKEVDHILEDTNRINEVKSASPKENN